MRELICGLIIGFVVGVPVGVWAKSRIDAIGDFWDKVSRGAA